MTAMKLPYLLLGILVILPATHGFHLTMMAPSASRDQAKVWGKKTSEGDPVEMTRAIDDPGSRPLCASSVSSDELNCDEKDFYYGFANVIFSQPTDIPRQIDAIMPDYTLNCTVAITTTEDFSVYWYVGWGLDDLGANEDFMKIRCTNSTNIE